MRQMAAEMHEELEATRAELRRGVLEIPQETADGAAQMRKVIVDQIEALAELNRIVARHGHGLDVATASPRNGHSREDEPMLAAAGARGSAAPRSAPRPRDTGSAAAIPPPDFGMAPRRMDAPPTAAGEADNDGWLNDLLGRATTGDDYAGPAARRAEPRTAPNPLDTLSLDIGRLMNPDLAGEMWDRYQRGENKVFTKRLYTPAGQKAFDEVGRKYRGDRAFKQTVDRYIAEFERLIDDIARDEDGAAALGRHLTSETGLVYTLLAHASGRLA